MPEFIRQDYHTQRRLKRKWRRPKGKQSKLRVNKGGSGVRPRIGFGKKGQKVQVVGNLPELEKAKGSVLLASQLGSRKSAEMAKRAGELGITILNKRKLKKAEKIAREIRNRQKESKPAPAKEEKKVVKEIEEKPEGTKAEEGKVE